MELAAFVPVVCLSECFTVFVLRQLCCYYFNMLQWHFRLSLHETTERVVQNVSNCSASCCTRVLLQYSESACSVSAHNVFFGFWMHRHNIHVASISNIRGHSAIQSISAYMYNHYMYVEKIGCNDGSWNQCSIVATLALSNNTQTHRHNATYIMGITYQNMFITRAPQNT